MNSLLKLDADSLGKSQLSDHTYLVTGAANGIGHALAIALAGCNASVILLDKDHQQLNQVYDSIMQADHGQAVIVDQDLTLLTQHHCDLLVTQIETSYGRLDGIIHCAAETGHLSPISHYSEDDWSKVMRANLHSPYLLTRALFPLMTHNKPAAVIFSSAPQALRSSAYWGAFAVAQQGLKGLVETWAEEIENTNIQMFMLDPGKVNTGFLTRLFPGLNPNHFPDSNSVALKYLQLLVHSQRDRSLQGSYIQLDGPDLKINRPIPPDGLDSHAANQ